MIYVESGHSYNNGIEFKAERYKVNFESHSDVTKIFLRKNKEGKAKKISDFIERIPFIRGLVAFGWQFIGSIFFILLSDISRNMILVNTESNDSAVSMLLFILLIVVFILIIIKTWKTILKEFKNIKSVWQYHGAEHKVILTNDEGKDITFENCRNASRINDDCGTMFVFLFFFILIAISIVFALLGIECWFSIRTIIALSTGYELFLMKRDTPVICWIFKLGYWFQENVCTREPSDLQLKQAIEAFGLLEKAETDKIPDEELQELLKNGKEISF